MLKGFVAGSLALIALYVVVQPGTASKTELASNTLVQGFRRLFSPQIAGIGDHSKTVATDPTRQGAPAAPLPDLQPDVQPGQLFTL